MKVNVYTREDKVKGVELQLEVSEYFIIQKALRNGSYDDRRYESKRTSRT